MSKFNKVKLFNCSQNYVNKTAEIEKEAADLPVCPPCCKGNQHKVMAPYLFLFSFICIVLLYEEDCTIL